MGLIPVSEPLGFVSYSYVERERGEREGGGGGAGEKEREIGFFWKEMKNVIFPAWI